ncbi:MAG TPA: AarF/UbiB family protein [Polyangiaceae bacterium]|nr:AarF/UbiB family protein [Polyangiaceae bacterium]
MSPAAVVPAPAPAARAGRRTTQVLGGFAAFFFATLAEEALRRASPFHRRAPRKGPARLRALLEGLGGAFIKFGQLFSMRHDVLPPDYCEELATLFDNVPPFPTAQARAIIERELGRPVDELFVSFDDRPVGAASFGQVHRVVVRDDDGEDRPAVVKVCRPESEATIATDARLLLLLGWVVDALGALGHIRLLPIFRDFVKWTKKETNYLQEAKNADHLHELSHWNPRQRIPYVYWEKTSHRVLTMEYLAGPPVSEVVRRFEARDPAIDDELAAMGCDRKTLARHVFQTFLLHAFVGQAFHGDPHPGNLLVLPENVVGLVDFGLLGRLDEEARREQALMLDAVARENIERLFVAVLDVLDAPRGLLVTSAYESFSDAADAWLDACDNPGAPLGDKTINRLIASTMSIARAVGLVMPTQTMLFYKGLLSVDAVVLRLDPDFDYKREAKRALRLIRLRELDRMYTPGSVLDTALLAQLLVANLPDVVTARLQEFEQGRRLIYRKLNRVPIVLAAGFRALGVALAAGALSLALWPFAPDHLRASAAAGPAAALRPGWPFALAAALVCAWVARALKARSFSKVQRDD